MFVSCISAYFCGLTHLKFGFIYLCTSMEQKNQESKFIYPNLPHRESGPGQSYSKVLFIYLEVG